MKPTISLLAATLALGLAACNNQDPANDTTGLPVESTAVAQGVANVPGDTDARAGAADALGAEDRAALEAGIAIDRELVALAGLADEAGAAGETRRLAESLRTTHATHLAASRRLLDAGVSGAYAAAARDTPAVAGSAQVDTTHTDTSGALPTPADADAGDAAPDPEAAQATEAARARLGGASGEAFMPAWTDAVIERHEAALARLDQALPTVRDEGVARHVGDLRRDIAAHLDQARALQRDMSSR